MKTIITSLIFSFWCLISTAQTTAIPDPYFEQALIDFNIDSDGIVNGQVLTTDIEDITELEINSWNASAILITNLTGIEDFISLQKLVVNFSEITELNISNNTQLKILNLHSNHLTNIDVSSNTLLEEFYIGNELDLGPFNEITDIDLSSNPNIKIIEIANMPMLDVINIKNGNNNPDMTIYIGFDSDGASSGNTINTVCIQVDDEELAQANQFPYSEWTINDLSTDYNFSENCALGTSKFQKNNIVTLYPNPATNVVNITSSEPVTEATIYNLLGQKIKQLPAGSATLTIYVSSLTAGTYFVVVKTDKGSKTEKLVIK